MKKINWNYNYGAGGNILEYFQNVYKTPIDKFNRRQRIVGI